MGLKCKNYNVWDEIKETLKIWGKKCDFDPKMGCVTGHTSFSLQCACVIYMYMENQKKKKEYSKQRTEKKKKKEPKERESNRARGGKTIWVWKPYKW